MRNSFISLLTKKNCGLMGLLLMATLLSVKGQNTNRLWLGQKMDMSQVMVKRDSFNMLSEGKMAGYWIWQTSLQENSIRINDISVLSGVIEEQMQFDIDINGLYTTQLEMNMKMDNMAMDVGITRESHSQLTGQFKITGSSNRAKSIDSTYSKPVVERSEIFALLPALPLNRDFELKFDTFFNSTTAIRETKLKVEGMETVKVPAGTFRCFKLSFTGGEPENVIYISAGSERRIVKVEVSGQPLEMVLVGSKKVSKH